MEVIVFYVFGEYVKCDVYWCGFLKVLNLYKYKLLLYGKDLYDEGLWKLLFCVFVKYVVNVDKFVDLEFLNLNENFN